MTQLKSLAHPEWPYAGTDHEWRGFAKSKTDEVQYSPELAAVYEHMLDKPKGSFRGVYMGVPVFEVTDATVYQKQNFGPELA